MAYMPLTFKENLCLKFLMDYSGVQVKDSGFGSMNNKKVTSVVGASKKLYTNMILELLSNKSFLDEILKGYDARFGYYKFENWFLLSCLYGLNNRRILMPNVSKEYLEEGVKKVIENNPVHANDLFYLFNSFGVTQNEAAMVLNNLSDAFSNVEVITEGNDTIINRYDLERLTKWTHDLIANINERQNCDSAYVVLLTAAKAVPVPQLASKLKEAAEEQLVKTYLKNDTTTTVDDLEYIRSVLPSGIDKLVENGNFGDFWQLYNRGPEINVPNVIAAYEKFGCNPFGLEYPVSVKDVKNIPVENYERILAEVLLTNCTDTITDEYCKVRDEIRKDPIKRKEFIKETSEKISSLEESRKDAIALAAMLTPDEAQFFIAESGKYEIGIPYLVYNLQWLSGSEQIFSGVDKSEVLQELKDLKNGTSKAEEDFYYKLKVANAVKERKDSLDKARVRYNNLNPLRRAWISAIYKLYKNAGPVTDTADFDKLGASRADTLYLKLGKKD